MSANFFVVILLLVVIGCLLYIYWLHHTYSKNNSVKKIKENPIEIEEDNASWFKSNYDMSLTTKDELKDDDSALSSQEE